MTRDILELRNWRYFMTLKKNYKIILASTSPRRKLMLEASEIPFSIVAPDIEEKPLENENGHNYVERNAVEKAHAVSKKLNHNHPFVVISADTIVVTKDDKILEKPKNAEQAKAMLQQLSANTHIVLSAYSIHHNQSEVITRVIETFVTFRQLSENEIDGYIATGEPFDKAGSYGIQAGGMGFVENIQGSYTNVMGLPLSHVLNDLKFYFSIESFAKDN